MSLYTIMDIDYIMDGFSTQDTRKKNDITYKELSHKGVRLEVMCTKSNRYIVNRIISTDPKDYLKEEIQPGLEIELVQDSDMQ